MLTTSIQSPACIAMTRSYRAALLGSHDLRCHGERRESGTVAQEEQEDGDDEQRGVPPHLRHNER